MKNKKILILAAVLNLIGVVATITMNALAVILPINGKTTQYLSDSLPNLFVPAGLTFSVWGVIYILLICFGIYQLAAALRKEPPDFIGKIGWLFVFASIENCGWILAWHYQQVLLSLFIMIVLLLTLLFIYLKLDIPKLPLSKRDRWFVQLPFSVYTGWITVATVANATAWLVSIGWDGFGIPAVAWTVLVIGAATAITVAILLTRKDVAYSLVILWAFLGIAIKRLDAPKDFSAALSTPVGIAAIVGMGLIVVAVFLSSFKRHRTV